MKSIHVVAESVPEAWEQAVVKCWGVGDSFPTQFDKPDDPNSRDVAALIHVTDPLSEPRIHRGFPGGLDDLEKYRMEVLYGVHDHWIDLRDPAKWDYTYYSRMRMYEVSGQFAHIGLFDQFEKVVEQLKACPHTRRSQMTTWQPWRDPDSKDPPCLQRMWFRCEYVTCPTCHGTAEVAHGPCVRCENSMLAPAGQIARLNMNIHIRSNDSFKAGFMNMDAFVSWQKMVADAIGAEMGDYIHMADSFHIYGSYFEEFEGFLKTIKEREFDQRVYDSAFANVFFQEGCEKLLAEDDMPEDKRVHVRARLEALKEMAQ